jgi:hypothetical protein
MLMRGPEKIKIPENATVLPWSVVFLVLFLCVACVSSLMSMLDTWRAHRAQRKLMTTMAPQPVLDEDSTEAPLIPVVHQRRYDVSSDPQVPIDYLYSDSAETRYSRYPNP